MVYIEGEVNDALEARVSVRIIGGLTVDVIVDTGFDGALVLPREIIEQLGLPVVSHETFRMVGGAETSADIALAEIAWLDEVRRVDVIVRDDYLLGAALLARAELHIDYPKRTVRISQMEAA